MAGSYTWKSLALLGVIMVCLHSGQCVCPSRCSCLDAHHNNVLVTVDCSDKGLEQLPDLSVLTEPIYKLDLSGNRISKIDSKFTSYVGGNVSQIILDGNQITEIPGETFSGLSQLEYLSLRNNKIHTLGSYAFKNVIGSCTRQGETKCKVDLTNNPLKLVHKNAFSIMKNLEIHLGRGNKELNISEYAFYQITGMPRIQIQSVPKLILPPRAFTNAEVAALEIANTTMDAIGTFTFQGLAEVETIHIHHSVLKNLSVFSFGGIQYKPNPEHAYRMAQGKDLRMANAISDLKSGGTVKIEYSQIQNLPTDCFRDTNLAQVDIKNNHIKNIEPYFLRGLASLKSVSLQGNIIHTLPTDSLGHMTGIRTLYIDRNDLKTIEGYAFRGLQDVGTLIIQIKAGTHLSLQSHAFSRALDISRLGLVGDSSETLPKPTMAVASDAFEGLVGVHSLDIANIRMSILEQHSFRGMGKIHSLSFIDCNITRIEPKAFGPGFYGPGAVDNLDLSRGNNLMCGCTTSKLLQEFEDIFVNVTLTCSNEEGNLHTLTHKSGRMRLHLCTESNSAGHSYYLSSVATLCLLFVCLFLQMLNR